MTLENSLLVVLSSVLLTEVHVVQLLQIVLESGSILMEQWCLIMLLVKIFTEVEEMNQTIRLNRRNNAQSPTGSFCCELPDNSGVTHRLYVTLGMIHDY